MAGYMNPDDATIGAPRRKKLSIGAPRGRDIFASHWADAGQGDIDPEAEALSYAKSFHQALNNGPARAGMIKPIDPFAVMQSGLVQGGEVPGLGAAAAPHPALNAIRKALQSKSMVGAAALPEQVGIGGLDQTPDLEALGEAPALSPIGQVTGQALPQKKGKMSLLGGALKRAILGR